MKKSILVLLFVLAVILPGYADASLFTVYEESSEITPNIGYTVCAEGVCRTNPGDIPLSKWPEAWDYRSGGVGIDTPAGFRSRYLYEKWIIGATLLDNGIKIYNTMWLTTYPTTQEGDPGYGFAHSGWDSYAWIYLSIAPSAANPAGSTMSFYIETETSGTPWASTEWGLEICESGNHPAVIHSATSDNYIDMTFDLIVGEIYLMYFYYPNEGGLITQQVVDGSIESGFDFSFVQTNPVPIPGAIWLLGSGLIGLIGFRRKLQN